MGVVLLGYFEMGALDDIQEKGQDVRVDYENLRIG
jgi:hypothetical protein